MVLDHPEPLKRPRGRPSKNPRTAGKKPLLYQAFARSIKPEQKLSIVDWSSRYVKLARSSRSEWADLRQTPWLIEPIETILGNDVSEVVIAAPTGGGKSTLFEIIGTYIVAEKPGPTLFCTQTNPTAQEWMETGLKPALKNCSLIDRLWPKDSNSIRKDFVNFPHMTLWVNGANKSNLQSKSCDTVLIDECWLLEDKGMLDYARKRTHDRFNSKCVFVSQAGILNDDFDLAYKQTYTHQFAYHCPSCQEFHPYNFDDLKWSIDKNEDLHIWETLDVSYHCPCGHVFNDNATDRRSMAESGRYIPAHSSNPLRGHKGFHFTALNLWWVEWRKIVIEFLRANEQKQKGDFSLLTKFIQQRLARPWDESTILEDQKPIAVSDYSFEDASPWDLTILTADVQLQDIWYVVRTWTKSGESRLLECGKVLTFSDLEKVQTKWGIKSPAVFLDSAYRTEEVKTACGTYGWLGLNGRGESSYQVTSRNGRKYKRIYSGPNQNKVTIGTNTRLVTFVNYSSIAIKDILFILKGGNGSRWEVPKNVTDQYLNMMNSEIKIIKDGSPYYKKVKDNNHWLDCECMQVVGSMMHGHTSMITETE